MSFSNNSSTARPGTLSGLRVLELGGIGPGPYGAMILADHGADVIRIERPGKPFPNAADVTLLDRGKRIINLDLKDPEHRETALMLAKAADVVVEGWRPGVAERLGVGPETVTALNPKLIYARMTGWGQSGPLAMMGGHDINYIAVGGALHAFGRKDGPPIPPLNLVGDFAAGGMMMAFGIMAAIHETSRSGEGQVIDCAMVDGVAHLMTAFYSPSMPLGPRGTNMLDTGHPLYEVYETSDGEHMAVGALEPQFFTALLKGLEIDPDSVPGMMERDRWEELRTALADGFARRTQHELTAIFDGLDACVTPIIPMSATIGHPHSAARAAFVSVEDVVQPAPAPRFSRTAGQVSGLPAQASVDDCVSDWSGPTSGAAR